MDFGKVRVSIKQSQPRKSPQRFESLNRLVIVPLAFDGEQAWLVVLGLADPPHPVHFLWSHRTSVQRVKRGSQIGDGSGSRQAEINCRVRQVESITITRRGDFFTGRQLVRFQQVAVNVTIPGLISGAGNFAKMSRSAPGCTAL